MNFPFRSEFRRLNKSLALFIKFQAPKHKSQINHNDPNTKFQKNGPDTATRSAILTGKLRLAKQCDTALVNVLVIEYSNFKIYLKFGA